MYFDTFLDVSYVSVNNLEANKPNVGALIQAAQLSSIIGSTLC